MPAPAQPRPGDRAAMRSCTVADFDYHLPPALIAQHPAAQRSASRLLDGTGDAPVDRVFGDLPALLAPGDLLVFNDTRVIKARLYGRKPSGGAVEALIERVLPGHEVLAHLRAAKPPKPGTTIGFADGAFDAEVLGRGGADGELFRLRLPADPLALLERYGHVPLPPYITHADAADDVLRYQTVFAARPGAVAAPTASLHFDAPLLAALERRGIERTQVTLHVGAGTFQPVRGELEAHRMHSEWYEVPPAAVEAIARARARGSRVIAAGTTTLRALESAALSRNEGPLPSSVTPTGGGPGHGPALGALSRNEGPLPSSLTPTGGGPGHGPALGALRGALRAASGETTLFIRPGFEFRVVDRLITNFHLPRSTLLMLVSAFAGLDKVRTLYRHAIDARYRFYSYGDAMLISRA